MVPGWRRWLRGGSGWSCAPGLRAILRAATRAEIPDADCTYRCDTSLRTSAKALLQHVRDRCSIENSWHWVRDVPLAEDGHRYQKDNGVRILATQRSLAIHALRLVGIWHLGHHRRHRRSGSSHPGGR